MKQFKLIKKESLTSDVFHMSFEIKEKLDIKAGQFITFILPKIGGRAYSILKERGKTISLIIKRLENGRGGSKYICDLEIGEILKGVGPAGNFLIKENNKNKLFIGTGTGLVPIFNQIKYSLENQKTKNIKLIFGVRYEKDLFLIKELIFLKKTYENFDFEVYLSREDKKIFNYGYVTQSLNKKNIIQFEEFYICGMPNMVDSSIMKLKESDILNDNIYTEKY